MRVTKGGGDPGSRRETRGRAATDSKAQKGGWRGLAVIARVTLKFGFSPRTVAVTGESHRSVDDGHS